MESELPKTGLAGLKAHWKDDLKSGFNISLIALPLSLGIALASGFPPIAGMFAAIIGGLFVSRTNGSYMTIAGPAAGLIVVNLTAIEMLGEGDNVAGYQYALAAIIVAGVLITIFGFLKAGKLGDFFPTSAIHGMLAAIGVIIMVKQFFVAVAVRAHGHEFYEILEEIPIALKHANPEVVIIAIVSLLILILYPKINSKFIKAIPAPIWVLAVAIPMEFAMDFEHEHTVLFMGEAHKVGPQLLVHLPENIADGFVLPDFGKIAYGAFWISVVTIALVTSIESLLSALAVDSLDPYKRKSNLNKDLKAMGAGSSLSGLIGGLPMISEIVRSSANVTGGAKTQWSNFFHGGFLLVFLLVGGPVIDHIPLAALAAMLIHTGYRLASPKEFKHVYEIGKMELVVFVTTLVTVLLTDLLIGVGVGILVNMIMVLLKGSSLGNLFKAKITEEIQNDTVVLRMEGAFAFTNYLGLKARINKHSDQNVTLDLTNATMLDHTVIHHLHGIEDDYKVAGKSFKMTNDSHLNPVSEHPLAERRSNVEDFKVAWSERDHVLGKLAKENGWKYNPGSSMEIAKWEGIGILTGNKVLRDHNIMTKRIGNLELTIADVKLNPAKDHMTDIFDLTALHIYNLNGIPDFVLQKEQLFDKVFDRMSTHDIDFESHPEFSHAYLLTGKDEEKIRSFFNDRLLTFLEKNPGYHIEGREGELFICSKSGTLNKDEIKELITFSEGILQSL